MSRFWILGCASLLVVTALVGCCRSGGYCKRGGVVVPCACGYTYPHFVAPSFGPPGPVGPYGPAPDPYYGGQPSWNGTPLPSANSQITPSPTLAPAPSPPPAVNGTPPAGPGT